MGYWIRNILVVAVACHLSLYGQTASTAGQPKLSKRETAKKELRKLILKVAVRQKKIEDILSDYNYATAGILIGTFTWTAGGLFSTVLVEDLNRKNECDSLAYLTGQNFVMSAMVGLLGTAVVGLGRIGLTDPDYEEIHRIEAEIIKLNDNLSETIDSLHETGMTDKEIQALIDRATGNTPWRR